MLDDINLADAAGLNIAHLNVASILGAHKFEMLRKQLESSHIDIFCASETWLTVNIPNALIDVKGFGIARVDRGWADVDAAKSVKRGGGLICYVREGLVMNEFRYEKLNQSCRDVEMQWVSLEMPHMRRIVIVNVYRPPQGSYRKACKLIHDVIKEADLKDNAEIFLLGDFNIDLNNKSAPQSKELINTTNFWGLRQFITGNTRLGTTGEALKGSCIDNIFSNSELITQAGVADWNFSDHLMVVVKRKRVRYKHKKVEFEGRSYKNYGKEELQSELINEDWGAFYQSQDAAVCWEILEGRIRQKLSQ